MRLLKSHILRTPPARMNAANAMPANVADTASVKIAAGRIYFDGDCGLCAASARRLEKILSRHGFVFVALQSAEATQTLGLRQGEVPDEMKLRTSDGNVVGGADAAMYVARQVWWAWPLWTMSRLPGAMPMLRRLYTWVASNRHRAGACKI